jgi:hypothetical protein
VVKRLLKLLCEYNVNTMKPTVVADEMFPEGAGPYMDLEEVAYV